MDDGSCFNMNVLSIYYANLFGWIVLFLGLSLFEEPFFVLPLLEGEEDVAFSSYVNTYLSYS